MNYLLFKKFDKLRARDSYVKSRDQGRRDRNKLLIN